MNVLARHGLHDLEHERFNVYGQVTHISSVKLPFSASYTNLNGSTNSLRTGREYSFTNSASLYFGLALWRGAEFYWVPEMISERPLSDLKGLGGAIQNFELQKSGGTAPTFYNSRIYLRQTIDLGGKELPRSSDPLQLGTVVKRHRLVISVGKFSILDWMDKNTFAGDLRRQFLNMAFLTYAAYDFAADARGYAWGGVIEYYNEDWVIRLGRTTPPKHPNQLQIDFDLRKVHGDQLEIEHTHQVGGKPGAIRLLGYRNRENMGRFDDALSAYRRDPSLNAVNCQDFNYGSANSGAPDLCWVRKPNLKLGIGLNVEQQITSDLGLFLRAMVSDGRSEVYSYTSTDRSLAFGLLTNGSLWRRRNDQLGFGVAASWISKSHANYLNAGGVDGFIGDGRISRAAERVSDVFYSLNVYGPTWVTADYQAIVNPAFNAARGPAHIVAGRFHAEL